MSKWKCTKCGYIYDEHYGDAKNGIPRGTQFTDLPEKWVCPRCGATKDKFVKVET